MQNHFSELQSKLDKFRVKLAEYELLKGFLRFLSVVFGLITLLTIAEFTFYFSVEAKSVLLILLLLLTVLVFVIQLINPVINILLIKSKVTDIELSKTIEKAYPQIKDKLHNTLELQYSLTDANDKNLIEASIEQKCSEVNQLDFNAAIKFKNARNVFIMFAAIFSVSILSIIVVPGVNSAFDRLVDYRTNYSKPSPYSYTILNDALAIGKGENFKLQIRFESENTDNDVQLVYGNSNYFMVHDSADIYSYQFNMVNNSISFQFLTNGFYTEKFLLEVLLKPFLTEFNINVDKPGYTNLEDEVFENTTQITVPEGSNLKFSFKAYDTDSIFVHSNENIAEWVSKDDDERFVFLEKFLDNTSFSADLSNSSFTISDAVSFDLEVIKDRYPSIKVVSISDSTNLNNVYFKGNIEDDYGFNSLEFVTQINGVTDSVFLLNYAHQLSQQDFFYGFNFSNYRKISTRIEYYFRVKDNDEVNGSKSAVSEVFQFIFPSEKEFFNHQDSAYQNIEQVISKSQQLTREIQNDLNELKTKMINNELSDWERKDMMKNIYSKKQKLEDVVKEMQLKNEEINSYLDSFSEQNTDLIEKQEQIQGLLENLLSDELKELMEEFNKMMDQFNESKINDLQPKIDISLDDLNEQLDKNLEVLRKMQMEQKLDQITQKIEEIAKAQEDFVNTQDDKSEEQINEEQKNLQNSMNKVAEEYEKLEELNTHIEDPFKMMDFKEEFKNIDEEFKKTIEQNSDNNKRKLQKSAEQNLENLKNLASMISQMQNSLFSDEKTANIDDLMQILDNLVIFSIEQEEVINRDRNSPFISEFLLKQEQLKQNFKVIEDSLYALAKKEISINSAVNKELVNVNSNFQSINSELGDGNKVNISRYQQSIMTSANNLALLLSEIIKQLQNQMANSQPGDQNCEKPGNNPNPNSTGSMMKQLQRGMKEQLGKMMQMMKDGASKSQMNKELGKALSRQEMMQNMLQQMMNQGEVGSGSYETLKQAEQLLNDVKNDILRSNVNRKTIERNEQILTRLLESEKAEQERGEEEKRKSNTAQKQYVQSAEKYFENVSSTKFMEEKVIRNKLFLQNFYQVKYNNYVNQLDSISGKGN